jgi:hypothetical protein
MSSIAPAQGSRNTIALLTSTTAAIKARELFTIFADAALRLRGGVRRAPHTSVALLFAEVTAKIARPHDRKR